MATQVTETTRRRIADWQAMFMLPRSIWVPILAMSVVALCAFLFNEWTVERIRAGAEQLATLTEMRRSALDARAYLADAEAEQRGFLLSRDPQFLVSCEKSIELLASSAARLRAAAASDAAWSARVQRLDSLRDRRVAALRANVLRVQQGGAMAQIPMADNDAERRSTEEIRHETAMLVVDLDSRAADIRVSETYNIQRSRIAFAALGLLTLALLVLAVRLLVKDFWRLDATRQEQAMERKRLERLVRERTAELSDLTSNLQSVAETEKAELARNLHDELGGVLTAAKMDLAWLQGRAGANEPEVRNKLNALASGLQEAMDVKQRVVENLRPALLDHFGLPTALESYFEETCRKAGLQCKTRVPERLEPIAQELAIALFRVGQEALTNIIRHARANNVEMSLDVDDATYRIHIADDGVGIDPARLSGAMSHGLLGMRHRVETLQGQLSIAPNVPRGTRIDVSVPR